MSISEEGSLTDARKEARSQTFRFFKYKNILAHTVAVCLLLSAAKQTWSVLQPPQKFDFCTVNDAQEKTKIVIKDRVFSE